MAAEGDDAKAGGNQVAEQVGFGVLVAVVSEGERFAVELHFVNVAAGGEPLAGAFGAAEDAEADPALLAGAGAAVDFLDAADGQNAALLDDADRVAHFG